MGADREGCAGKSRWKSVFRLAHPNSKSRRPPAVTGQRADRRLFRFRILKRFAPCVKWGAAKRSRPARLSS